MVELPTESSAAQVWDEEQNMSSMDADVQVCETFQRRGC